MNRSRLLVLVPVLIVLLALAAPPSAPAAGASAFQQATPAATAQITVQATGQATAPATLAATPTETPTVTASPTPSPTRTRTPTATLTPWPTYTPSYTPAGPLFKSPTPNPFQGRIWLNRRLPDVNFLGQSLGSIAVDARGQLYVGDAQDAVIVFSPDAVELRRFQVPQPFALAINKRGELLVAQRFRGLVTAYDLQGKLLRTLWSEGSATTEALAVGPDDSVYILWKSVNPPITYFLTRLNASGSVLYTRPFLYYTSPKDGIHGITFDLNGNLNICLSGFGNRENRVSIRDFTPQGDPINEGPVVFTADLLTAPAPIARLRDGSMTMYAAEGFFWWTSRGQSVANLISGELRDYSPPAERGVYRAAIAVRPDGESLFFAEIQADGALRVGIIQLTDLRISATPSLTHTPTATPTVTRTPTRTPTETETPTETPTPS